MVEKSKRKSEDEAAPRQPSRLASSSRPAEARAVAAIKPKIFTVTIDTNRHGISERLRILIPALRRILPNLQEFLSTEMALDGKQFTSAVSRDILTRITDSPQIQAMALDKNLDNAEFVAAVLDYAQEALGLPTEPRASTVGIVHHKDEGTLDIQISKLNEMGMFTENWPIPITAAGMVNAVGMKKKKKKNKSKSKNEDVAPVSTDGEDGVAERKQVKKKVKEEPHDVDAAGPSTTTTAGKKRRRKSKIAPPPPSENTEDRLVIAPAGAAVDGGGRGGSIRNVGKASLPKKLLDIDSDDEEDFYFSASEYEEEVKKVKKPKKEATNSHAAGLSSRRSKLPLPSAPAKNLSNGAGTSSDHGALEPTYVVTAEHRQSCYWLRRTGPSAGCFRNKEQRHDPPAPLKAEDLTSCHDCQGAHVRYTCQGDCAKSYCQACCRHYEYLFSSQPGDVLAPLLEQFCEGVCPCCLDICGRKDCLRKRSKVYKFAPQVPEVSVEERRVMALHMARCLVDVEEKLMAQAEKEATRQNTTVAAAYQLPKTSVEDYRLLCNRCATSMENMIIHCQCGADFCPQCCTDLMGDKKGPLQCPVCLQTTTSIQRVLSNPELNKLNNTQAVLDKAVARGGAAINAYDYKCKLWRLPTAADRVTKPHGDAQGASGSNQKQSCMETAMPHQSAPAAAAPLLPPPAPLASVVVANGNGIPHNGFAQRLGAPVLQSTAIAVPPGALINSNGNTVVAPASTDNGGHSPSTIAKYLGINSLSMQLLAKPVATVSREQIKVLESVFDALVRGDFRYGTGLDPIVAPHAAATMQQVNEVRRISAENGRRNNNINNVNVAPPVLLTDGAGPSAAARTAAGVSVTATAPPPPPAAMATTGAVVGPNLVHLPTRPITVIPGCIDLVNWHKDLPPEDYRLASNRPNKVQNYIWTPHVADFARNSPRRHETVQRFVQRWAAGEPIIIRGMRGHVNWGPDIVMRAARDLKVGKKDIAVTNCSDWGSENVVSAESFFKLYTACHGPTHDTSGVELAMFKLKDFPPDEVFAERCKRHNDDFLEMLNACMPEYMHPKEGVLNLASKLPLTAVPPDLGPKGYIAFGREEEHENIEGDSVTRLHEDLSDAINILCHVQHPPGTKTPPTARCGDSPLHPPSFGGAGALWDLYRREDIPVLRQFILDVVAGKVPSCPGFYYKGKKLTLEDIKDPVHDQAITLTSSHRAAAALPPYNLHSWLVEQYEFEGVVIPAACAHQVRNLRSCIKIALDFVSPESVPHCLAQREERRILAMQEVRERGGVLDANEEIELRHFHDKLQVVNMVVHGLSQALDVLEKNDGEGAGGSKRGRKSKLVENN